MFTSEAVVNNGSAGMPLDNSLMATELSALSQSPLGHTLAQSGQRLGSALAATQQALGKLLDDVVQIRNQVGDVLSGLANIELAALAPSQLGQTSGNGLAPLMQATHEAFAASLLDAGQFLNDLRNPFLPTSNG